MAVPPKPFDPASLPFDVSRVALGGFGQVLDSVELLKRTWGSLGMATPLVPTMDIAELDKRIADLKAVEQWLNLNLGMLRGTIQGLEIQRGTLAAVQAFGSSLGVAGAGGKAAAGGRGATPGAASARAAAPAPPARAPVPEPRVEDETDDEDDEGVELPADTRAAAAPAGAGHAGPGKSGARRGRAAGAKPRRRGGATDDTADRAAATPPSGATRPAGGSPPAGAPSIDPGAWWNMLQSTFNQVAGAALSGVGLPGRDPAGAAAGSGATGRAAAGKAANAAPAGRTGSAVRRPKAKAGRAAPKPGRGARKPPGRTPPRRGGR